MFRLPLCLIMSQILQKIASIGEARDKELLKSASSIVYKTIDKAELTAHVFFPEDLVRENLPVIAFFHGGFWDTPMVTQFVPHCHHFASRGMIAITFEYRVSSKHNSGPLDAKEDARDAILWLHENASSLGIDVSRLILGGAAGGAWLALNFAMQKPALNQSRPAPAALILFSALVNTGPKGQRGERFPDLKTAKQNSPSSLMRRKLPPILFIHGRADRVTPYSHIVAFRRRLRWRGNFCEIVDFVGAEHSFFNFNVSHTDFERTIVSADLFLIEKGLLAPLEA